MKEDPEGIRQAIKKMWPLRYANLLIEAAESGQWDPVIDAKQELRNLLGMKSSFSLRRGIWFVKRLFYRSMFPSGLHIVFLGPDGCGKTSVTQRVVPLLDRAFFGTTYIHFRFFLGRKKKARRSVNDPHGQASWSLPLSVSKVFYYWFDYFFGWWLIVWPKRVRSKLIVFDRYYYDMVVDPKRCRYGGPMWLVKQIGKFIVKPDMVIYLDVPPEILQERKKDVTFEESKRQREEYRKLMTGLNNSVVIDGTQPLDGVVADVNKAVLDFMTRRMEKRLGF
jgi:thymidylate kinase